MHVECGQNFWRVLMYELKVDLQLKFIAIDETVYGIIFDMSREGCGRVIVIIGMIHYLAHNNQTCV